MNKKKVNEEMDVKGLVIITVVLCVLVLLIYLLTLGAQKLGWFNEGYVSKEVTNAVISYEKINAGTVFKRSDSEYYVFIADLKSDKSIYSSTLVDIYKNKEGSIPLYIVDLSEGLNKFIISEENNYNANNASELKVKDNTLIKIQNGARVSYVTGDDAIKSELGL